MSVTREVYFIVETHQFPEKLIQLFRESQLTVKPYLRTEHEVIDLVKQALLSNDFVFPPKLDTNIEIEHDDIRLTCTLQDSEQEKVNDVGYLEVYLRVDSYLQSLFPLPKNFVVIELGFGYKSIDFTVNYRLHLCLKVIASVLKPFFGFSSSDWENQSDLTFKQPWLKTRSLIIFDSSNKFWFNFIKKLKRVKRDLFEWEQLSGNIEWVQSPTGIGIFMEPTVSDETYQKHQKAITETIKTVFDQADH